MSLSVPDSNRTNGEEQCLNWVNPITKMGSLINSRTGLVTQSSKIDRLTPRIVSYLEPENQEQLSSSGAHSLAGNSDSIQDLVHGLMTFSETGTTPYIARQNHLSRKYLLTALGMSHSGFYMAIGTTARKSISFERFKRSLPAWWPDFEGGFARADVISQVDRKFILDQDFSQFRIFQ